MSADGCSQSGVQVTILFHVSNDATCHVHDLTCMQEANNKNADSKGSLLHDTKTKTPKKHTHDEYVHTIPFIISSSSSFKL
jgi:hypothetical protein